MVCPHIYVFFWILAASHFFSVFLSDFHLTTSYHARYDTSNVKPHTEKQKGYMHIFVALLFLYNLIYLNTVIEFLIYSIDFPIFPYFHGT